MIIGSRTLTLRDGDKRIEIPVAVFAPVKEKPGVWGCRYEIGWSQGRRSCDPYCNAASCP